MGEKKFSRAEVIRVLEVYADGNKTLGDLMNMFPGKATQCSFRHLLAGVSHKRVGLPHLRWELTLIREKTTPIDMGWLPGEPRNRMTVPRGDRPLFAPEDDIEPESLLEILKNQPAARSRVTLDQVVTELELKESRIAALEGFLDGVLIHLGKLKEA